MTATYAFREAFMSAGSIDETEFVDWNARALRYDIFWSLYENTAYRSIHSWSKKMKADYGLYRHVRNIYNPTYRLASFWQTHLMGGLLDPTAGDGQSAPSALPIETDSKPLRGALARLWRDSNWQVNKDILTLYGSLMGDVALKICDDTERGYVYLEVVHPGTVSEVVLDQQGNVKAYEITEARADPRPKSSRTVTYKETVTRDGDLTVFSTFLDGQPFAWNEAQGAEWSEPYGFVPLVMVQHNNVGKQFGWSELHPGLSKFREADDQASLLNDQIRKTVNPIPFFTGMNKPGSTPTATPSTPTAGRPEPAREEIPALYAPAGADVKYVVAPLNIADTLANIKSILEEVERDYPELQVDIWNAGGDASGKALRVARQRSESKVGQRRPNYDDGLRRAQQMAVAIGGWRGYADYASFDLESYKAGDLEHNIGKRPVFAVDPLDDLEREQMFWQVAGQVKTAGGLGALTAWLKRQGWSDEDIQAVKDSPENAPFAQYP